MASRIEPDRNSASGFSVVDEATGARRDATPEEITSYKQQQTTGGNKPWWQIDGSVSTGSPGYGMPPPPRPPGVPSTATWDPGKGEWADPLNNAWYMPDGTMKAGSSFKFTADPFSTKDIVGAAQINPDRTGQFEELLGRMRGGEDFRAEDLAAQRQTRDYQTGLLRDLQAAARGEGTSVAQMELQRAGANNMQQAAALMASQRGGGARAANYAIGQQSAQIGNQTALDGAMLRAREIQEARAQLAALAGQARGQDLQLGGARNQAQRESFGQQGEQLGRTAAYDKNLRDARLQGMLLANSAVQSKDLLERSRVKDDVESARYATGLLSDLVGKGFGVGSSIATAGVMAGGKK